jgi:hypothetical protein
MTLRCIGDLAVPALFSLVLSQPILLGTPSISVQKTLVNNAMSNAKSADPHEVRQIAERAYIFGYPLVLMEATGAAMPLNRLTHVAEFPDASFRLIVRPNADTLYSTAWFDVSKEPMLLHVPDSGGRYYLLQFMDAWTETFADPGKRTTGTSEAWYAIVGPRWNGKLPERVVRLDAPTNHVWLLGRTQTNGASDYDNVHAFQRAMRLVPLSEYPGKDKTPGSSPNMRHAAGGSPVDRVKAMEPTTFFATFAQEMKTDPPHAADGPMVSELARIGLVPGQDFNPSSLTAEQLQALNDGAKDAAESIEKFVTSAGVTTPGWRSFQGVVGHYGTNYVARAATARIAIGANPPEDAVYMSSSADSSGQSLNGSTRYRMHFDSSNLPPVQAFWSVTAYDKDGYFIANPLNRYAIGDRDRLKFNPDGSLDLYIQSADPGMDRTSNWLPSGDGSFNLTIRLYWPKQAILDGSWHPPALESLRTQNAAAQ